MDQFRTEIQVEEAKQKIHYHSRLLFMGSCFASNIGSFFSEHSLNCMVNPFGVLYNPFSIANSLDRIIEQMPFSDDDVLCSNNLYHTFYHHSQFNGLDKDEFLEQINSSLKKCTDFLKKTDVMIITFGTAWVYQHNERGIIVSNCHKYPSKDFARYRLNIDEIVERYHVLLHNIATINPNIRFIFTVSPVRHWKDGAHGNQLSKSTLLLAVNQLIKNNDRCHYFPAYELLLDDLRDYRFFSDDMLHPSDKAIEYIRQKFISSQFDTEAKNVIEQLIKLRRASLHRPFNPETEAHQSFIQKHINKVDNFQKQFPKLDLSPLKRFFTNQLK